MDTQPPKNAQTADKSAPKTPETDPKRTRNGNTRASALSTGDAKQTNDANSEDDDAASDVSTENFNTGENVLLDGTTKAKVAYFGPVHFSYDDDWVGIALEEPKGKHNGTVAGTEYFKCDSMHGLFVRSHRLQRADSSGHATARVKSPYRLRPKSAASTRSQDMEVEDIFSRAKHTDPLGFFEVRAGTIKSQDVHGSDELSNKLGRVVEEMNDGDGQINFSSPWIHSSRTPTPTHLYTSPSTSRGGRQQLAKKITPLNKAKPYGITLGYGEIDH